MRIVRSALAFAADFVLGEDPRIAVVVVVGLGATALLAWGGAAAWWVLPVAVAGALAHSVRRQARGS